MLTSRRAGMAPGMRPKRSKRTVLHVATVVAAPAGPVAASAARVARAGLNGAERDAVILVEAPLVAALQREKS